MAAKHLFSYDLPATTNTVVTTVPAGVEWSFTINFCNRTDGDIKVRYALSTSGTSTPDVSEYFLYDINVPANDTVRFPGNVAQSGRKIICYSSSAGISVNGQGYEE